MPTRDDVARLAGTSTAVVSYVLNDGPRPVAAETRARVLGAVEKLGYRPNHLARALSARRSKTLGLIVPDVCNPYFAELARAVEDAAVAAGFVLFVGNSEYSAVREDDYTRILLERQVEAALLISAKETADIKPFERAGTPVVVLHRIDDQRYASSLAIDDEAGAFAATEHLIGHGYRDLLFVDGPLTLPVARQRQAGFDRAIAAHPGAVVASSVTALFECASAYEVVRPLLERQKRPRAIFAATDEQAIGILHAAYEQGLVVPDQLAVMGFDGTIGGQFTNPSLATVRQPIGEIASRAIELLTRRPRDSAPVHAVLTYELVPRRSCGCGEIPGRASTPRKGAPP
jgi:LacI family transcriptional regulator, galactose operon repressor